MPKDYTNKKFNRLTAINFEYAKNKKSYWKMKCDCGKYVIKLMKNVTNGVTKSCGCIRTHDLTGKQYSELKVINFSHKDNYGKLFWNCLCNCGNYKIARADSLREGKTKSCGCLIDKYINERKEKRAKKEMEAQQNKSSLQDEESKSRRFKKMAEKNKSEHKRFFKEKANCRCCGGKFKTSNRNYWLCDYCYLEPEGAKPKGIEMMQYMVNTGLSQAEAKEIYDHLKKYEAILREELKPQIKTISPEQHIKDMQRLYPGSKVYAPMTVGNA